MGQLGTDWVYGRGYDKREMQPQVTLDTIEFVERDGLFHVYRLVKSGKLVVSFNNQPEIRHLIRDNPDSIFAIGFFEAYSGFFGYEVEVNGTKQNCLTIARIVEVMKGDANHKRSISVDPSGIIIR